jgi:apolipoprotein N-acyltransferase
LLARERRWSACRVALQSFMLWHGLVLAGTFWHQQDFGERGLTNGYVVATVIGLASMGALYLLMEARSRRAPAN